MRFHRVLVDSGADWTFFPFDVASILGVRFLREQSHVSYRGTQYPIRFGRATLELSAADGAFKWEAVIGFTKAPIKHPMLGQIGCFDQLNVRFVTDPEPKIVEFEENSNYTGQFLPSTSVRRVDSL
jgi:hypothetical protein